MDSPTPAGFVADAEEALGKARAMLAQARDDEARWTATANALHWYLYDLIRWAAAGGTGPRPRKPPEPDQ